MSPDEPSHAGSSASPPTNSSGSPDSTRSAWPRSSAEPHARSSIATNSWSCSLYRLMATAPTGFSSVKEVLARLRDAKYIADTRVATAVYLADRLGKPLLIEGPAGVGKTELAKCVAASTGTELVRLQCYEGLDEARAL